MANFLSSAEISTALSTLATTFPNFVTLGSCPNTTARGATVKFVRIAGASSRVRTPILFSGGVHAREWTPPDALLSFATNLASAATSGTSLAIPAFSQPNASGGPVEYPAFKVPFKALISEVLDNFELIIVPVVNPDGRDFSLNTRARDWRKNRNPLGIPTCIRDGFDMSVGVDINRNFDIIWDFDGAFFDLAAAKKVATATTPCTPLSPETYRGPSANSEAETKNLKFLQEKATHFIDVHMDGRTILVPWGFANNQTVDASQNFQNPTLNGKRDPTYEEFMPTALQTRLTDVATFMHDAISMVATKDARSVGATTDARALQGDYKVTPSVGLYPASGCCDDFFFSRQFTVGPAPTFTESAPSPGKLAYTIECGHGSEQGFFADRNQHFPKIEREVHAALWGFLARLLQPAKAMVNGWPFII